MRPALLLFGALFLLPLHVHAQSEAPVPPDPSAGETPPDEGQQPGQPGQPRKRTRRPVAPGFEDTGDPNQPPDEPADGREPAKEETPPKRRSQGRDLGDREEEDDFRKRVDVPGQGPNERLIEDMNAATGEITLAELIEEILADVVAEIDRRPKQLFSPMAIRNIALGPNVVPSFRAQLTSAIITQVHGGTDVLMVHCVECEATRTRVEGKQWVITKGVVSTAETRRIAEEIGAKSFMDVRFGFDPETGVVMMDFQIVRASDSLVIWSDSFRADETTPMLMRSSDAPIKRKDRMRDLEMLLEGRPYYGYVATAGFMILPHNDPDEGDISGATAGYRIYERFGVERRVMFGLDLTGFLNTSRLAGAVISAGSWWVPLRPDFINPELRLGVKAGAFIAGSAGNAAVFQLGAEVILRYRFGLYGYVLFMTKSRFPPETMDELGGVGMATGMSFNW